MINVGYIHELDDVNKINVEYESAMEFFNSSNSELLFLEKKLERNNMFMESSIDSDEVIMESAEGILKKIGDKVIDLINKCIKFVREKIEALNHFLWEKKDKDKLLRKMAEEQPETVEKIRIAIDADKLKLNDFKDLATFYKDIDSVLDQIDKMDSKTVRGKMASAREKLDKAANTVVTVGKVAGGTTACILLFKNIMEFVKKEPDERAEFDKMRESIDAKGMEIKEITAKVGNLTYKLGQKRKEKPTNESVNVNSIDDFDTARRFQTNLGIVTAAFTSASQSVVNKRAQMNMTMYKQVNRILAKSNAGGEN